MAAINYKPPPQLSARTAITKSRAKQLYVWGVLYGRSRELYHSHLAGATKLTIDLIYKLSFRTRLSSTDTQRQCHLITLAASWQAKYPRLPTWCVAIVQTRLIEWWAKGRAFLMNHWKIKRRIKKHLGCDESIESEIKWEIINIL